MDKLYCIENLITGKRYIGYTSRDLNQRVNEHFSDARTENRPLYNAIKKYGKTNFKCFVVYEGADALEKEDGFIQLMGDYNLAAGGNAVMKGYKHSAETKSKMSAAAKNVSTETREKRRIAMTGFRHSEETKKRMSSWQIGKTHKLETIEKIRASKIGRKASPETKQKMSESQKKRFKEKS